MRTSKITREQQRENAINELTSTILENDYNRIVKILSDSYARILSENSIVFSKDTTLKNAQILLELISSITEYGRVETDIHIEYLNLQIEANDTSRN